MECSRRVYLMTYQKKMLETFIKVCINTLNKHAPSKKKYTRGNHLPFMNKELSKAIMNRTRLRNVYLRKRSDENRKKYSKQRNYCVSLLRRTKRNYYSSLDAKSDTGNNTFWRTVKQIKLRLMQR